MVSDQSIRVRLSTEQMEVRSLMDGGLINTRMSRLAALGTARSRGFS